jgi:hypothetical protein
MKRKNRAWSLTLVSTGSDMIYVMLLVNTLMNLRIPQRLETYRNFSITIGILEGPQITGKILKGNGNNKHT